MLKHIIGLAMLLVSAPVAAQDKATLDTREILAASTQPDPAIAADYRSGAYDQQPTFVRTLDAYKRVTAPPIPVKKPVGINVASAPWYAFRQTWWNILQGGYWADSKWAPVPSEKLDSGGYPTDLSQSYVRLLGVPTGGVWNDTKVACTWKGSGSLTFGGGTNMVKGDHTLAFTIPSWNGVVANRWFSLSGVSATDPFRDFECHDANPANASGNEFSKEIVETLKPYSDLRFMDWSGTNNNPARTLENRPNPKSLDRPGEAIENQVRLANLTNANLWVNLSWRDSASYNVYVAQYVHDNLKPGLTVKVENSNEVWNWQFDQAQDNLVEATALKLNPNNGYGAWQNYSRRFIEVIKPWERIFADRPGTLIRVLGTQVSYLEVTRQELKWPGILDHIDAIAGAPYFSHDRNKPYSDALLRANIADTVATLKATCDTARALKPTLYCYTYEGGQHELPTDLLPQAQFEALQRSQVMGDLYGEYLTALSKQADLIMLYYDVGAISRFGAWGQREYGGQVGAPKQVAVDRYLAQ